MKTTVTGAKICMLNHVYNLQENSVLTRATYGLVIQRSHRGKTSFHWICKLRDKRFRVLATKDPICQERCTTNLFSGGLCLEWYFFVVRTQKTRLQSCLSRLSQLEKGMADHTSPSLKYSLRSCRVWAPHTLTAAAYLSSQYVEELGWISSWEARWKSKDRTKENRGNRACRGINSIKLTNHSTSTGIWERDTLIA